MKRLLAMLMTATIFIAAMGGCSGEGGQSPQPEPGNSVPQDQNQGSVPEPEPSAQPPAEATKITFVLDKGMSEFAQSMIDEYHAQQDDVEVEMIVLPYDANVVHDDFVTKLAGKDTTYTILGLDVVYVTEFAKAGWITDLGTMFDSSYFGEFLPGAAAGGVYDGKQYGLPWMANTSAIFGRQDILDAAGTSMPTTWAEYKTAMEQLAGQNDTEYGTLVQGKLSEAMLCNWLEFIWSNGGDIFDSNGNYAVNTPQNVEATEFFAGLIGAGAPEGCSTYVESDTRTYYMEGRSVFCRDWAGTYNTFNTNEASKIGGKLTFAPLPIGPQGTSAPGCLGGLHMVVNSSVDDATKAAAKNFMEFMLGEHAQNTMAIVRTFPGRQSSYTAPDVVEAKPEMPAMAELLANARPRPQSPQYARLSDTIQRNIHPVLTGEKTAEEALATLQSELESLGI